MRGSVILPSGPTRTARGDSTPLTCRKSPIRIGYERLTVKEGLPARHGSRSVGPHSPGHRLAQIRERGQFTEMSMTVNLSLSFSVKTSRSSGPERPAAWTLLRDMFELEIVPSACTRMTSLITRFFHTT